MIVALIVAAGRGSRMAGPTPKQYRLLGGAAVLRHTVLAFHHHPAIALTQVVIHPEDAPLYAEAMAGLDLPPAVIGGATRQDSVRRGIEAVAAQGPAHILIHDAVRPFVAAETIAAVIAALSRHRAVIAGLPVVDTLKRCRDDIVTETLDRAGVWRAQTPQGFRFPDILAAHRALGASAADLTDDSLVAERAGIAVAMVLGHEEAFKITTEPDLARAEAVLRRRRTEHGQ
jgi:2-C-methyl-D-erythritol 4-phosphate cytidylyltransferase